MPVEFNESNYDRIERIVGAFERVDAIRDKRVKRACLQTLRLIVQPLYMAKLDPEIAWDSIIKEADTEINAKS